MGLQRNFAEFANSDLQARMVLDRWQCLAERSKRLTLEPNWLENYQPEPECPECVGMDCLGDDYTPEELVEMFNRDPLVVDWDTPQYPCELINV